MKTIYSRLWVPLLTGLSFFLCVTFIYHPGPCSSANTTHTPGSESRRLYRPPLHRDEKPDEPMVLMPEVTGKSETEAANELQRTGIQRWKIVEVQSRSNNDTIIRQEPQAGSRVNMKAENPAVIFIARPLTTPLPLSSPGTSPLPIKATPGVMVWPVIIVSQVLALFLVARYLKKYRLLVAETEDIIPAPTSSLPAFPAKRTALHLPAPEGETIKTGDPAQMPKEEVADWLLKLMQPEKAARKAEEDIANASLPRGLENPLVKKPPEGSRKKTGLTAFLDELASSEKPAQKTQRTGPQPPAPGGTGTGTPSRQAMYKPVISPAREIPEPPEKKTIPLLEFKDKMSEKDLQKLQAMAQKVSQSTAPSLGSEEKTGMTSSPGCDTRDSSLSHEAALEPPATPVREVQGPREKKTVQLNEFLDKMSSQDAQKLAGTPFDRLVQKRASVSVKPPQPVTPPQSTAREKEAPTDADPGDSEPSKIQHMIKQDI